jgi:hypothetical protein
LGCHPLPIAERPSILPQPVEQGPEQVPPTAEQRAPLDVGHGQPEEGHSSPNDEAGDPPLPAASAHNTRYSDVVACLKVIAGDSQPASLSKAAEQPSAASLEHPLPTRSSPRRAAGSVGQPEVEDNTSQAGGSGPSTRLRAPAAGAGGQEQQEGTSLAAPLPSLSASSPEDSSKRRRIQQPHEVRPLAATAVAPPPFASSKPQRATGSLRSLLLTAAEGAEETEGGTAGGVEVCLHGLSCSLMLSP